MPQLDTTLEGVAPWMTAPPLPKTTSFMEAFRMAQEQNSPQALADLKLKQAQIQHLGFQMQNDQLLLQKNKFDLENALAGKQAETEVSSEMAKVHDWSDPSSVARVLDTYSKRPTAQSRSLVNEAVVMHKEAVQAKDKADQLDLRAQIAQSNRELGAAKIEKDWTVAASKAEVAQARLEAQQANAEASRAKLSTPASEREDFAKLVRQESDLKTLIASNPNRGDLKAMLADVQTKKQAWEVQHNAREEVIESTPGGGFRITRGGTTPKGSDQLTTGEVSNYGEDLQAASNALRSLGQLKSGLSSTVVGPAAAVKSVVFDKFLAALDPAFENPERVKGRARIGATAQVIAGELGRKFRLSEPEMRRVEAALPSTGFFESPARAKDAVAILQQTLGEKGANAAVRLKRPVPTEILRNLAEIDDEALTQDAEQGYLDPKVYWQVRRLKYPKPATAQPAP